MDRKLRLAKLIKIETECLMGGSLAGQLLLAEEITRDANALADLIIQEQNLIMFNKNVNEQFYSQMLEMLSAGMFDFDHGSDAAHALRIAAQVAYSDPTTTLKDQIEIHCGPYVKNLTRMVS